MLVNKQNKYWMKIIGIVLFAIVLFTLRYTWVNAYINTAEVAVENGEIDLSSWDFTEEGLLYLPGEWNFYPYALIESVDDVEDAPKKAQIPGDWSDILNEEENKPYGYGTYHLRIHVEPNEEIAYSMRVAGLRSSSALFVNGIALGGSGTVGENKEDAHAYNVPYTSSAIRADESGVIDLFIQGTNFEDPRSSGLVRSVQFGLEEELTTRTELSTLLQVTTAVIFIVHVILMVLIYIVGIRDKRLLYFALVIFLLAMINLGGGDEKILLKYGQMEYVLSFKLSFSFLVIMSWAIVQSVRPQVDALNKWFVPVYSIIIVLVLFGVFLAPLDKLGAASSISLISVFLTTVLAAIALIRSKKQIYGGIWLALSAVAITHHYVWWAIALITGLKSVYYPFDLIIAIICVAAVWAHHYSRMHVYMQLQKDRLEQADKDKNEFLATTSHELRNPLHSILNMSQAVLDTERVNISEKSIRNLEAVLAVSRHSSLLVNDLLEITTLTDGNPKIRKDYVSLPAVTSGVIDMSEYRLVGKDIEIINEIPQDFPYLYGDENRIVQILFNLLHNAIKFTCEGEIIVRADHDEKTAYISIYDTGIGIEKEKLSTIFDSYTQEIPENHMSEGGFGLGLSISKKLVELHGGIIEVDSKVGEGSVFVFTIPLATELSEQRSMIITSLEESYEKSTRSMMEEERSSTQYVTKHLPRIMVVDDDVINLQTMSSILTSDQYEVHTFISAKDALKKIDTHEWDLIISDVMMPVMSGYEFTRKVRQKYSMTELPILLLTARGRIEDIPFGFEVGTNDYVTKPVETAELRSRVKALTDVKLSARDRLELESAWLHAQIQPHFIFNTINSIIALSEIDIERMQRLLEAFSDVLRNKFVFRDLHEFVPIKQEINLIESYLHIEKERFRERLTYEIEVDPNVKVQLPTLTIQPLVENAVEHGLMTRTDGGNLMVSILDHHSYAEVTVSDDGVGIDEETLHQIKSKKRASKSGVGLYNTNMRLERIYGEGLTIESSQETGTVVSFKIPYEP